MVRLDYTVVRWIITINVIALGMLVQRAHYLGWTEPVLDKLNSAAASMGLMQAPVPPCGLMNSSAFILTSSRVVFPDGVRAGAGETPARIR